MRRFVTSALVGFLVGTSILFAATAHAQTAPQDATELTQAEFESLLQRGQLGPGLYIVDGVYTIVEPYGSLPGDPDFDPFDVLSDELFADAPDEYRFLIDPRLPVPPEFRFLEDPNLPVPPEWAFLLDARQPVPENFLWLLGPMADHVEVAPALEGPPTVPATQPEDEANPEADAAERAEEVVGQTLEVVADVVAKVVAPPNPQPVVAPTSDAEAEADPEVVEEPAAFAASATDTSGSQPIAQQPPLPTGAEDDFIVPLLIFVAVASAALLCSIPIFLRGRSKGDEALRKLVLTDDLTKLANRRRLDRDLGNHQRANRPIAVAMIDIDHFKRLNDDYSHAIGDVVLQQVAAAIADNIRGTDVAYRYGGEEFCVLLPDATEHEAASVVDRVRLAIERIVFEQIDRRVTISAGVATTNAKGTGEHGTATVSRADAALYAAKGAGRNRVMLGSLVD